MLLVQLTALRGDLDKLLSPPTSRASMMLARYPGGGARYARHRDAIPEHGRKLQGSKIFIENFRFFCHINLKSVLKR